MENALLIRILLLAALSGAGGLAFFHSQQPDFDTINKQLTERLLSIEGLDANISELALRNRINLDTNYDLLVRTTVRLKQATKNLANSHFSEPEMKNSLVSKAFGRFTNQVENKIELIENFKSHNSVLRNSEKYAPVVARQLKTIATQAELADVALLYTQLVIELLEYAKLNASNNVSSLTTLLERVPDTTSQLPDASAELVSEFLAHSYTAIEEKQLADQYLKKALSSTSPETLNDLTAAWAGWQQQALNRQSNLRNITYIYVLLLLILVIYIFSQLRNLYNNLDQQVASKSQQIKTYFEDLKRSEKQLAQTENMASLGLLTAGVAHEINTPLSYISSNLETIRDDVKQVNQLLKTSAAMSAEMAHPSTDNKRLGGLLKRLVLQYRKLNKTSTTEEIDALLEDTSVGVKEISQMVNTLQDFSRAHDSSTISVSNVPNSLETTLKMCKNILGDRQLVIQHSDDLPAVKCISAQLNQVFMNIISNAAHATDSQKGLIEISTRLSDDTVVICFKDNGIGMSPETQERVFEPFYTTKDVDQGTGLGMSICYKIITGHSGEIIIDSEEQNGTSISLVLPAA